MKLAEEGMAIVKLLHRRQFLQLAAGAAAPLAVPHVARAQSYPSRPVTLVVPIAAGGGLDTAARILAEKRRDNGRYVWSKD
jgi:tripartite-type tricarboxylate transporter receptor subunit TctC